ncbi:hypothetical protein BC936DRAFT_145462 [Jimgerdemannia flammicorona]|uniref:Uncharacterized protein n=1 Tax=Jimgerdemannia flammicorona TaxID=994334 RepID=A0A433D9X5_9FUNG|nr:hypothetical protein BC936DRAFT_145462 [Jimgerdemannia flammicorona]
MPAAWQRVGEPVRANHHILPGRRELDADILLVSWRTLLSTFFILCWYVCSESPHSLTIVHTFPVLSGTAIERLKIVFEESTDFYGRITVYKLVVLGEEA